MHRIRTVIERVAAIGHAEPATDAEPGPPVADQRLIAKQLRRAVGTWVNEGGAGGEAE